MTKVPWRIRLATGSWRIVLSGDMNPDENSP
jgi:hypothetical protein